MIPQQFLEHVVKIPSRFTEVFGPLLYGLILANRPQVMVETGTCWGYLTAWMALGAQQVGAKFYSIDFYSEAQPHVGPGDRPTVEASLEACGVRDSVQLITGEATWALWSLARSGQLQGLGMVQLDDEHTRAQVVKECEIVLPFLEDWGLITGHDVFDPNFNDMAWGYRDFAVMHRLEHVWLTQSSGLIVMQKRPAGSET